MMNFLNSSKFNEKSYHVQKSLAQCVALPVQPPFSSHFSCKQAPSFKSHVVKILGGIPPTFSCRILYVRMSCLHFHGQVEIDSALHNYFPARGLIMYHYSFFQEGRECICTVCTCGHHKCPQKHTSVHTRFDNIVSEYGAKYPEWPIPEKFQRKIPPRQASNARMASATTYTDDYVNHPFGPSASCRPNPPRENTGSFQKETTYNVYYYVKSGQMCSRAKPPQAQHLSGKKFEGQSVYQSEYPNHGVQPRCKQVIRGSNLGNEGGRFDGDSTYHDDYWQWQLPAKFVHKRVDDPPATGKVCGPTTYQLDYIDRQVPGKCPVLSRGKPGNVCGDHMCY